MGNGVGVGIIEVMNYSFLIFRRDEKKFSVRNGNCGWFRELYKLNFLSLGSLFFENLAARWRRQRQNTNTRYDFVHIIPGSVILQLVAGNLHDTKKINA